MAEKKRQCGTCRFFVKSESRGHGKCTHPKRDKLLREMVLLRPNELGCRTRWGTSLWQDIADTSDPFAPETPQQPTLPDPIPAQLHYDDEVTSVSIAGSKTARKSFEDGVVDSGAVAPGKGSWNDSDQEERRRLLMYGEHDAVAGARKRHVEKQAKQRELIPFAEGESKAPTDARPETPAEEPQESEAAQDASFSPEDFVEKERSLESDTPVYDDELMDDGVRPGGKRSPRVNKLLRDPKSPKDRKAMVLGTPSEIVVTSNNPENRGQWYSVPSKTPGFDLPFMEPAAQRPSTPLRVSAFAAPMMMTPTPSRLVSQARERVSEDRLRGERARRQVSVPMAVDRSREKIEDERRPAVTNRPQLTQAPEQRAAQVDRFKSSPLRGYHPAVKAAAARTKENEAPQSRSTPSGSQRPRSATPPIERAPHPVTPRHQFNAAPEIERQHVREDRSPKQPRRSPEEKRRPVITMQEVKDSTPFFGSTIEIAPQVPACCGTCISFRPDGEEGRGTCANEFAGPVQRVVYEQDLACQHTFGCFWIPADEEVWLEALVQRRAATPRVDNMIARRAEHRTVVLPDLEELTS